MNLAEKLECARRALLRNKKLRAAADANPVAFLAAMMKANELGVSFDSPTEARFVPDKDAEGKPSIRLYLTKKGMVGLAMRYGMPD